MNEMRKCLLCGSKNTYIANNRKELALRSNNKRVIRFIQTWVCKDCNSDFIIKIEKIY